MDCIPLWTLEHLMKDIYGGDHKPVQQGARGRYFGLCESLPCESSQRQFVNERVWLCVNKTLFIGISLAGHWLRL